MKAKKRRQKPIITRQLPASKNRFFWILGILGLFAVGIYLWNQQNSADNSIVSNYDECIKAQNSTILPTYPQECKSKDGITYIENIHNPVSTANWSVHDTGLGFTFLCPPTWNCSKANNDSVTVYQNHYLTINTFQLNIITPENFQKSFVRNPNYVSPIAWYNDLIAKRQIAIQAPISTRIYRPGTDGYSDPVYTNYDFNQMRDVATVAGKGIVMGGTDTNDINVIVPLNNNSLVFVTLAPNYLYKNPIIAAILQSITAKQ